MKLIGRAEEQTILQDCYDSTNPEFLAVFGRRRVGKTFLIKRFFEKKKCYFFSVTGIQKGRVSDQISRFTIEIGRVFYQNAKLQSKNNWYDAFDLLLDSINKFVNKKQKVVLFLDEFPWMATPRSKLLSVVEYFWNQYWSHDPRIKLIICGSSASWIIKKIINNKGGLHNRVTKKIQLRPFNLAETKSYLSEQGIKLNNHQISQLYMVAGGIPFYLSQMKKGLSSTQQIEQLAFKENSLLFKEFDNLFSSLFKNASAYIELLRIIAGNHYGLAQEEIILKSKNISRGGRANDKLKELEQAGFILSFIPFQHKKRGVYFRLVDEYTLFYFKWIEPIKKTLQKESLESGYWEKIQDSPSWYSWSGYAFESLCYKHISQIRNKLGISPSAIANTWRFVSKSGEKEEGAQIDLLFDRRDNCITLCEIKYSENPFLINKDYAKRLANKRDVFIAKTKTSKHTFMAIIASHGLKNNVYADDLISQVVTLDDLF